MMREHMCRAFEKWKSNARLYKEMEELRKEVVASAPPFLEPNVNCNLLHTRPTNYYQYK